MTPPPVSPGRRARPDTAPVSGTPIYDSLYAEFERLFRTLPGDRTGEAELHFKAFSRPAPAGWGTDRPPYEWNSGFSAGSGVAHTPPAEPPYSHSAVSPTAPATASAPAYGTWSPAPPQQGHPGLPPARSPGRTAAQAPRRPAAAVLPPQQPYPQHTPPMGVPAPQPPRPHLLHAGPPPPVQAAYAQPPRPPQPRGILSIPPGRS